MSDKPADQGRETAMNKNNYCSYQTATHYCGKQGGHTGEHYLHLKLIAGHRANCINLRDEAMCDCGALEPQTEQAYHARGAGALIAPIRALIEYHEKYAKSHVSSQWIYGENMMVVQAYKKVLQMIETLREPSADTGTTPQGGGRSPNDTSPMYSDDVIAAIRQQKQSTAAERGTTPPPSTAEFEPPLRGELKHGRSCPAVGAPMDEGSCDCGLKWRIRLQTEMTLRNAWEKRAYEAEAALAATERGPTPPEGLTLYDILNTKAFNGSMHQAKQIADEINAKRAATQRAPVEQGRDIEQERLEAEVPYSAEYLRGFNDGRRTGVPDHAREGATMRCPKCGIDVFAHGETCPVSRKGALHDRVVAMRDALKLYLRESLRSEQILAIDVAIQAELERALADGKEGGE